ncbi:MAG: glutamine synthetase family protein [Euryarchaeota archaeon]|nr:glutamine synthetase family protein [Euryarchaeota archaeon]
MFKDMEGIIRDNEIKIIRLKFVDISGTMYAVSITESKIEKAVEQGIGFDSSSIPQFGKIANSDMKLRPDPSTFKIINGERKVGSLICDITYPNGKPYEKCTRSLLKNELERYEEEYILKPEMEFFLTKDGEIIDEYTYLNSTFDSLGHKLLDEFAVFLEGAGIKVEKFHHENGKAQYEIEIAPTNALEAADSVIYFKEIAQRIAHEHDVEVSFLPKPFKEEAGSGMHVHQELRKNGKNLFGSEKLTELGERFIAGQLHHINGLTRVLNSVENSYERFGKEEAPRYVCWGYSNRSTLIRIPPSGRIEIRSPDPACNPYLAFFFLLKTGLSGDGELPDPVEGNAYEYDTARLKKEGIKELPNSLKEAEKAFIRDPLFNEYAYLFE